jgi:hypothetical protein
MDFSLNHSIKMVPATLALASAPVSGGFKSWAESTHLSVIRLQELVAALKNFPTSSPMLRQNKLECFSREILFICEKD